MKSDIQKKWEEVYGKKQNYDISGEYYYNDHGKFRKGSKWRKILSGIGTFIVILLIIFARGYLRFYTSSDGNTKLSISNTVIESNKNGKIMHNSISKIEQIMKNTNEQLKNPTANSVEILNDYIQQIISLDLSNEYDDFIIKICEKIQYGMVYINYEIINNNNSKEIINNNNSKELINDYNSISYTDELANAFEKASVKYSVEDNNIHYEYVNK